MRTKGVPMHFDEERIQRLLHGELEPEVERLARDHLGTCQDCRELVHAARVEEDRLFGLLHEVDHALPEADSDRIFRAGRVSGLRWQRWAAGILLVAAAGGVAYAAPGSPLPAALRRFLAVVAPSRPPSSQEPQGGGGAPAVAGIAVEPGARLTIRFTGKRDGAVAAISLTDSDEVVVRAVEGTAAFSSELDRLSVRLAAPARFEILIPRSAPTVEVVAGEHPIFRIDRARVITEATRTVEGGYLLKLDGRAP